jgi:hypothetical protein
LKAAIYVRVSTAEKRVRRAAMSRRLKQVLDAKRKAKEVRSKARQKEAL